MSKKGQKALASASIMSLVLTTALSTVPVFAAPTTGTPISGGDRVATSVAMAKQAYSKWTNSTVAVIANGANAHLVDALTVAPLAYQKQAPVFLTNGTTSVESSIIDALKAQKVTSVYVVGGAVTSDVDAQLKAAGITTVTHLFGASRFDTAAAINTELEKGGAPKAYAVVNTNSSVADALSIAAVAAAQDYEIVLAKDANTVSQDLTGKTVYAIGGSGVLSDALVTKLAATRLGGDSRFATNGAVLKGLDSNLDYTTTYVADGTNNHLVDSLPGSVLAGQTKSPIVLVDNTVDATAAAQLNAKAAKITNIVPLGGAVSASALSAVNSAITGTTPTGNLTVTSVSAKAANSILVKFSQAPADTSKVTFTVATNGSTPVTTTVTWNDAKTEATLNTSYNLPEGTYNVGVKNDTTDLGSNSVSITQEKVAKININSTVLSVVPLGASVNPGEGFATYQVLDQYGNDITNTPLGNNITWNCGIGTIDSTLTKNGVIAIKPINFGTPTVVPLTQYTSAVINGYDTNSFTNASATLNVSQSAGTISDITLNKLTSPNNDDFNVGNTTGQWYLDYTAKDASGNETTSYTLIKSGILQVNGGAYLNCSVVQDPKDNTKAAIAVNINPAYASNLPSDMQIPINIMTTSGKSTSLNVTLKKATSLATFNLSAPSQMVASGETITLPFTAKDQNGNAMTSFNDVNSSKVTITASSGTIQFVRNGDGTAAIQLTLPVVPTSQGTLPVYITATVIGTANTSQLTLTVQQPAASDSLDVDNTVAIPFMQKGASQWLDTGWYYGGVSLNDQYGRKIDLLNQDITKDYYKIVPTVTSGNSSLTVSGSIYAKNQIELDATSTPGTATVLYKVVKHVISTNTDVDTNISKTVSYTVVKDTDITDYTLDEVSDPIKTLASAADITSAANAWVNGGINARDTSYAADPEIWGKTAGGAKVVLAPSTIVGESVDSNDFAVIDTTGLAVSSVNGTAAQQRDFGVLAKPISNPTSTGSSTNLNVTVKDATGNYETKSVAIKSTTAASTISKVAFSALNDSGIKGISVTGNTVNADIVSAFNNINGKSLVKFDNTGSTGSRSWVYFKAYDQYGTSAAPVAMVNVTDEHFANSTAGTPIHATVSTDGNFTLNVSNANAGANIVANDYIVLTAVSGNQQSTVKIIFTGAYVKSSDATLSSVKVKTVAATQQVGKNIYDVVVPNGTVLSTLVASDVVATATNAKAVVGTPATADGGATWTVDVTAEDGTKVTYTINVIVAP